MRQKTEIEITLHDGATGEARSAGAEGTEARAATTEIESRAAAVPSMEAIVERDNRSGPESADNVQNLSHFQDWQLLLE